MRYFSFLLTFFLTTSVLADGSDYWYSEESVSKKKPKVVKRPKRPMVIKRSIVIKEGVANFKIDDLANFRVDDNPANFKINNRSANLNINNRPAPSKINNRPAPPKINNHPAPPKINNRPAPPKIDNGLANFNNDALINRNRDTVLLKPPPGGHSVYRAANAARPGPSSGSIEATYNKLNISSIWTSGSGHLNGKGKDFLSYLRTIGKHGLKPNDYYLPQINRALARGVGVDKLISRAFVKLASHAALGKLLPKKADPDWHIVQGGISQKTILKAASSNSNVRPYVERLFPQTSLYKNLVVALGRQIKKGGWSEFPTAGPKLQLGSSHQHVPLLRERLYGSGYLQSSSGNNKFDRALSDALINFQNDHGLNADGILGRITRLTLAKSSTARSKQIVTTLERLRWLPNNLGGRYIMVNTAGYQLNMIENNRTSLNMRIVVGKKKRGEKNHETPSFSKDMRYLVLNPRWYVPPSIASEELLLLAQKDRNFFKKEGYKVYNSKGEVRSNSVNWNRFVKGEKLPLQIVQNAGARNALGKIKFMLPNKYNVYLHDTPQKSLFARDRRAFSHGCVRLSKPMQLATKVTGKSKAELSRMISSGRNQKVDLAKNIPVYIVYLTVWARNDGSVIFFDDYFNRDSRMQNNFS